MVINCLRHALRKSAAPDMGANGASGEQYELMNESQQVQSIVQWTSLSEVWTVSRC